MGSLGVQMLRAAKNRRRGKPNRTVQEDGGVTTIGLARFAKTKFWLVGTVITLPN